MLHYNVWFSFKPGTNEELGLAKCRAILNDLVSRGGIDGFEKLKIVAAEGDV